MQESWHYSNRPSGRQEVAREAILGSGSHGFQKPLRWIEVGVSPTIFQERGFRFFFYSREEPRIHVHVHSTHGDAKFWLEPDIELAENYGLNSRQISTARRLIEEHADEIKRGWQNHFRS